MTGPAGRVARISTPFGDLTSCAASSASSASSRLLRSIVPASASAAKKPKPAAWAAKHKLKGAWKAKDADRDGLKNLKEFKLGTNPRKADSDRDGLKDGDEVTSANNPLKADSDADGVKDGAEHAGVVTAFDGETITIKQFNGPKLTAHVDGSCDDEPVADDSVADDEESVDDGFVETSDDEWVEDDFTAEAAAFTGDEETLDLGDEDVSADDSAAAATSPTSRRATSCAAPRSRRSTARRSSSPSKSLSRSRPFARSAAARARRSPPAPSPTGRHLAERVAQLRQRDHLHVAARGRLVGGHEVDVRPRHLERVQHPGLRGHDRGRARPARSAAQPIIPPVESMWTPSASTSPAATYSITDVEQPHSGWIRKSAPGCDARMSAMSLGRMPACTWHSPSQTCILRPVCFST